MEKEIQEGLAGVIVGQTAISSVSSEGHRLTYRGYAIEDLAKHAHFEEVAFLLIHGHLPTSKELSNYHQNILRSEFLPAAICQILEQLPKTANPMDVLRTAVSSLGCIEMETLDYGQQAISERLIPYCVSALFYWHYFRINAKRTNIFTQQNTIAGHFLHLLMNEPPTAEYQKALDIALILYAEHEFNASTFAARVAASTGTDFYSAIVAAISTLRGPLHGGANEAAMRLMNSYKDVESAEKGIHELLEKKSLIMGFGHRVYKDSDPRSAIVKSLAEGLAKTEIDMTKLRIAEKIEEILWQEKKLFPNLDFYSALVFHFLGVPTSFFTPIFVISRISGWSAHIIEQRAHNRLIRPNAEYIGPTLRTYLPIKERSG